MCTRRGRRPFGVAAGLGTATTRCHNTRTRRGRRRWWCGNGSGCVGTATTRCHDMCTRRGRRPFGVATVWVCGCSHSRSHNTRTRRGRRRWWSRLTVVWQRVRVRLDPERLPPIIEAARLSPRDSWSPSAVFGWSLSATVALARDVPDGVGRSDGDRAGASARERGGTRGMPPRRSR